MSYISHLLLTSAGIYESGSSIGVDLSTELMDLSIFEDESLPPENRTSEFIAMMLLDKDINSYHIK